MAERSDDLDLVKRIARRDVAALETLASRYEPMLLGLARGLLSNDFNTACDAVQDCWVRVIRSAKGFRGDCEVRTWLYRIVVNRCHDLRARASLSVNEETAPPAPLPTDSHAELRRAVDRLSHEQRLLVLLCYHSGLTHPQVADVLGIPEGTVKSRLNAALASLRRTLGEEPSSNGAHL